MKNHLIGIDKDSLSTMIKKRVDYFHLRKDLIEFNNGMPDEVKIKIRDSKNSSWTSFCVGKLKVEI